MNHNELVGFTNTLCSFYAIIFKDKDDQPQIQLRMDVCKNLFREKGIDTEEIQVKGNTQLEKIFLTLNKIDWVCYYLALEYGYDPTPVRIVEDLKKQLKKH